MICTTVTGDNPDTSITCQSDAQWGNETACITGVSGAAGACLSATSCGGYKCLTNYTDSGSGCVLTNTYCDTDGSYQCSGGQRYRCESNQWVYESDCADGASCADAVNCGECHIGDTLCIASSGDVADTFKTCESNAQWGTASDCITDVTHGVGACLSGTQCGGFRCLSTHTQSGDVCLSNDTYCENNGDYKCEGDPGKRYLCDNHEWVYVTDCADGASCSSASECGECRIGDTVCTTVSGDNADTSKTCMGDAHWGDATNCTTTVTNGMGACSTLTSCGGYKCPSEFTDSGTGCIMTNTYCENNGEYKCTGNPGKRYHCENNTWTYAEDCQDGASCADSTTCGSCHIGDTVCSAVSGDNADTSKTCQSNAEWGSDEACLYGGKRGFPKRPKAGKVRGET